MNAHARFSRIAALLVLLVLAASGLRPPAATPRVQAMQPQDTPAAAISTSAWIPLGPAPALNGQQDLVNIARADEPVVGSLGGGPNSGGHNLIVASPTDPNTIYIGADGGIWKTTNATAASPTWTPLIDDKPSLLVQGLSADPTDATFQTFLAGTDRAGLYYTTDGGASWTQISNSTIVPSGYSGGYRAVAARGNTLLVTAATTSAPAVSGLFRTTGGPGGTWTKISGASGSGLPNAPADGLVGDPANPNRLYVMVRGASGGIFRSDDTGATWTNVSAGITIISSATSYFDGVVFNNGTINAVTVTLNGRGANPFPIASATQSGTTATITTAVAHGFSAGQSVTIAGVSVAGYNGTFTIGSVPSGTTFTYTAAASGLAGGSGGTATSTATVKRLFRSVNGAPFTALDTPSGNITFMSADKTNPDLVYVGGYEYSAFRVDASKPSGSQVTRLSDEGATTLSAAVTSSATTVTVAATIGMPTTLPFVVTIDSEELSVTAISGRTLTVVRGVNGTTPAAHSSGATVLGYNYGKPHPDYTSFAFDATGRLLAGSHGGIYRLPQPGSPPSATNYWVPISGDIGAIEFDFITYDPLSNKIFGGTQDNGVPEQTAAGTWSLRNFGDGADTAVDNATLAASNRSIRYSSSQNLAGFKPREFDAAGNFVKDSVAISLAPITDARFYTPVALNAVDPKRLVFGGSSHVYESLDRGTAITSIANDGVGAQNMVYGGYRNGIANPDFLFFGKDLAMYTRTTAGGAVTQTAFPAGAGKVKATTIDPSDWMTVFMIDENGRVYRSTDGGSTWSNITGDLITGAGSVGVGRMVTIVPGAAGYLIAATDGGVFASLLSNLGTWTRLGTGIPILPVRDVAYDATDDVLVIGTYGRGAYTLPNASREFNDAPTLTLSGPTTAAEGTTASYTFTVTDANVGDTFSVDNLTVSAGGSVVPDSLVTTATGGSFQVSFPDGPASPTISLVVQDSYAVPSPTATRTVTVGNVAPTATILGAPTSVAVGTAITLSSGVTDPSAADTSAGVTLAWSVTRDGSPFASGSGASFSFTPTTVATYVVTLTATDQHGAAGSASATITVTSFTLTENHVSVTVAEGGTATNSGTYRHPGPAPVTLSASVGTLAQTQTRTLFADTFDAEPLGIGKTTLFQWTITQNQVDVIGLGLDDQYPGNGRYLDLASFNNATIQSKTTFALPPGEYQLSFEIATNTDGPTGNILRATLGSTFAESFAATTTMTRVVRQFTVSSATSAPLIFTETGTSDPFGSILNDVTLVQLNAPLGPPNALNVLGYWQLGEDDPGAATGLTGNNPTLGRDGNGLNPARNLTRFASPTYTSAVAPTSGSVLAMTFDANSDQYIVGNPVTTATDNFGLEAWVKFSGPANTAIAENGDGSTAGFGLRVRTGTYEGRYGGVRFINSGAPVVFGQWQHVALVRNNGLTQIYVDGVLVHQDSLAGPHPATGVFGIGFSESGSVAVDDVRIFTFAPGTFNPQDLGFNTSVAGSWSWTYATDDGPSQSQDVTITSSTGVSGETTSLPFPLVVTNVAPTATLSNGGAVSEGSAGSVAFSGQSDPSPAAVSAGFHYAYDFDNDGRFEIGDGTYAGSGTAASATVPASFLADGPGTHIVRGRIIDKDDGATDYTTTIPITNATPVAAVSGPTAALAG